MQRLFFHNLGWKLGSLILAALTWLLAREYGLESLEAGRRVRGSEKVMLTPPVKVLNEAHQSATYRLNPSVVQAAFRGVSEQATWNESSVQLFVDVSSLQENKSVRLPVQVYSRSPYLSVALKPPFVEVSMIRRGNARSEEVPQSNDEEF